MEHLSCAQAKEITLLQLSPFMSLKVLPGGEELKKRKEKSKPKLIEELIYGFLPPIHDAMPVIKKGRKRFA